MESDPTIRVIVAGIAGAAGLIVAVVSGNAAVRIIALAAALLVAASLILSIRKSNPQRAVSALFLIPLLALVVGIPAIVITGAMRSTVEPDVGDPGFVPGRKADERQQIPTDPDAQLRTVLDRADQAIPDGSATVLRISLRPDWLSVTVFNPRTGEEVVASRSSNGAWNTTKPRRANDRKTFSRAEVAGMNLTAARPKVMAAAAKLKMLDGSPHASDGITVKRRYPDDKLVGEFSISGGEIEVDANGQVADTVAAATLETMLPLAVRSMTEAGADPAAAVLSGFDFRAFDDAASSVSASAVQNSGGFAIDFAYGPISQIVVVPGLFPQVRPAPRERRPTDGFALNALTTDTLLKIRADLMARANTPAYDADLIGLEVDASLGHHQPAPVIRMQVGPSSARTRGTYSLTGQWLREGR